MNTIQCLNCHATTSNGLALCELCQRWASAALEFLPVYFANIARWRPGRAGARPVPSSRVLYDGDVRGQDRVSRALDEAGSALSTWARALADDRGIVAPDGDSEADQAAALCRWFSGHLTSIATLEWCGEFLRDVGHWEATLRELTEQVAPGWYAGACRRCEVPTHVVPGLTWVTCGGCGATTYARDHLPVIIQEARAWVDTPRKIAGALVALLDDETDVERLWERIRRWGRPESVVTNKRTGEVQRVIPAGPLHQFSVRKQDDDGDEVGPRHFRLGDVLDQLERETRTLKRAG